MKIKSKKISCRQRLIKIRRKLEEGCSSKELIELIVRYTDDLLHDKRETGKLPPVVKVAVNIVNTDKLSKFGEQNITEKITLEVPANEMECFIRGYYSWRQKFCERQSTKRQLRNKRKSI